MVEYLVRRTDTPFVANVANYTLPPKFMMLIVEAFDGYKVPLGHLDNYKSLMKLHNIPDEIMCRVFPTTLSINSLEDRDHTHGVGKSGSVSPRVDNSSTIGFCCQYYSMLLAINNLYNKMIYNSNLKNKQNNFCFSRFRSF